MNTPPSTQSADEVLKHRVDRAFGFWSFVIPTLLIVLITFVFRHSDLDQWFSAAFFSEREQRFPLADAEPWETIDDVGVYAGIVLGIAGLGLSFSTWRRPGFHWQHRMGLVLFLSAVIGPGLIVNGVMKPGFGRPRPREITEFAGKREFVPVGTAVESRKRNASFPSGHAAIGFFLMTPAFFFVRHPRWAILWFTVGLIYGGTMAASRVIQGGHFVSDVLWSLYLVYIIGLTTAALLWKTLPAYARLGDGTLGDGTLGDERPARVATDCGNDQEAASKLAA